MSVYETTKKMTIMKNILVIRKVMHPKVMIIEFYDPIVFRYHKERNEFKKALWQDYSFPK